jgi:hypothetical protein
MELVRRFLLREIEGYERRHGTGPTVRELAADLGLPADFGHRHLVEHLKREVVLERVSHYRGRFTLTTAGRLELDAEEARRPASHVEWAVDAKPEAQA